MKVEFRNVAFSCKLTGRGSQSAKLHRHVALLRIRLMKQMCDRTDVFNINNRYRRASQQEARQPRSAVMG